MRTNSSGCLATSGGKAEVQRGLHKLTNNPQSKDGQGFSATAGHCFVLFLMLRWASWILKSETNTRGLKTRLLNARKLDSWITVARTKVFSLPLQPLWLRYVWMSIICVTQCTAHFLVYSQVRHRATTADVHFYHLEIDKLIFYLLGKKEYLNGDKKEVSVCADFTISVFSSSVFISWHQPTRQTFL